MLKEEGILEPLDEILKHMKVSMSVAVQHYETKYQISPAFLETYKKRRRETEIHLCKPFPGIVEICKQIHSSGKRNYLYTHRGVSSIALLQHFGLYDYFSDCITSQHGFKRKPSPDAIHHLLNTHQFLPHEAIMIGDRELDMFSAKNAGIDACFFSEDGTRSEVADTTIHNFQQLSALLGL